MNTTLDLSKTTLETSRLLLRPFRESDLQDFYAYASVPGVGEMAGWPHHTSLDTTRTVLAMFLAEKNVLALEEKTTGTVIGSIGLHPSWAWQDPQLQHLRIQEVGYVLAKSHWGQGLMPEAVRALIRHCFTHCGLEGLTVGHFVHNTQSRRVIEKCGFRYVREVSCYAKQLDQTFPERTYLLLAADWAPSQPGMER